MSDDGGSKRLAWYEMDAEDLRAGRALGLPFLRASA
jgi:hypothetical protein